MSALKQIVLSLLVIAGLGWLWFTYVPGAREYVQKQALYQQLVPAPTPAASTGKAAEGAPASGPRAGGRGGGRGRGTPLVVTVAAKTETINTRISALGTGDALHSVTVLPSSSGQIVEVPVRAGQIVAAGDVLARLDSSSEEIAYDKAKLALQDARATLDRNRQLAKASAVSAAALQQVQLAADTADLGMRSAELDLKNRSIVAPIGGTVGLVPVSVGNEITSGTVIATIEDDSAILVNFWVPEALVGDVHVGDAAAAVPVARPDVSIQAVVVGVDNKVDTTTGTYEVQAKLPNNGGELRPGMSFTMSMDFSGDTYVAVNPLSIQWASDGSYIWRVADGKVQKVPVRIIQRNTDNVLVSGDLVDGDAVVTEGLDGLAEGTAVNVAGVDGKQPGAAPADAAGTAPPVAGADAGRKKGDSGGDGQAVRAAEAAPAAGN